MPPHVETGSRPVIPRRVVRVVVSGTALALLFRIVPLDTVLEARARINGWTWLASVAIVLAGPLLWQAVLAVTALVGVIVTQMAPRCAPAAASAESPATKA